MARPNPPRSIGGEDNLAVRIAQEREEREWSYEALASRMTDVGCPIQPSALHRIEKGSPRRRVTVDELIALSRVFEVPISDLLTDVALLRRQKLREVVDSLEPAHQRLIDAYLEYFRVTAQYFELAANADKEGLEFVFHHWFPDHDIDIDDEQLVAQAGDAGVTLPDLGDITVDDAVNALGELMSMTWAAAASGLADELRAGEED